MAISYQESTKTFFLDGKGVTYAFCINDYDYLEHLYFGKTIGHDDIRYVRGCGGTDNNPKIPGVEMKVGYAYGSLDSYQYFAPELAFFGTGDYREPAVQIKTEKGDRISDLLYDGFEILPTKPMPSGMPAMRDGETLVVHLKDRVNGFGCDLYYTVYDDAGVIARRAVYKNGCDGTVMLNRAYSFSVALPEIDYDVLTLHGSWASERHIQKTPAHYGVVSIDSKRTASSASLNPFMALVKKGATEDAGDVYGVNLIYSSSFVLKAEGLSDDRLLLTGGINDFDFTWKLLPGESFETPEVVIAYSGEGIGGMSRALHNAYRNHLINPRYVGKKRPIVINSWESAYFDFNTERLKQIVDGVAGTGVDTFVLDDGWFGNRNSEFSSLGDWWVNENKLPGGLGEIIAHVNSRGMKFGLWFEPEMINPDSELFRTHPDYAIMAPGREGSPCRGQYMLDLTRKDVRDFAVNAVNKILKENHIEYVKWDYNSNVTQSWSLGLEPDQQMEFAHRYALGVYDLFERIVEANPDIFFEGCSAGGARFDPAVLYYFSQIWTSDCTDADMRTKIQYGTSVAYPLMAMTCHVSAVPNHQTRRTTSIGTRGDIAHLGGTGYELDTSAFTDADRETVRQQVEKYHEMEDLLLWGDLYRTESPFESNYFGFMIVAKDKDSAHLTAYQRLNHCNYPMKRLKVRGLDPEKKYFVKELDMTMQGATWMNVGIKPNFPFEDFSTLTFTFKAV
jgi:alpha-galactosidase